MMEALVLITPNLIAILSCVGAYLFLQRVLRAWRFQIYRTSAAHGIVIAALKRLAQANDTEGFTTVKKVMDDEIALSLSWMAEEKRKWWRITPYREEARNEAHAKGESRAVH